MRTFDAIASLQARAPVEAAALQKVPARPAPAVKGPKDPASSQQSGLSQNGVPERQVNAQETTGPRKVVEYGPPDRNGDGWLDPPSPQDLAHHVDALI